MISRSFSFYSTFYVFILRGKKPNCARPAHLMHFKLQNKLYTCYLFYLFVIIVVINSYSSHTDHSKHFTVEPCSLKDTHWWAIWD